VTIPARIAAALLGTAPLAAQAPDFTRDVRPILSHHCFPCHGPDDAARRSGLRLDDGSARSQPAKSGRLALVPGDANASELVRRIAARDDDTMMPPPAANRPLDAAARDTLVRWIAAGAEYRPHWAFVPPVQREPPAVGDAAWPRNAIDRFVLARLEREGLHPTPEADRWTLVRRVWLDLVGLPPTREDAQAFVDDPASDAYERLVDRLLAMPQYGERWARRWLDLARYADTNGYEKDRERSIWPWRDEVVRALNADQPFDRFTIEQLAGDMLPDATADQIVATGFHRNTMLNEEGGIDPLEYRFHALCDRVATTGTVWLGLTLGCAQCHTHKFDPIPQREYYAVMACLDNADDVEYALPDPDAVARAAKNRTEAAALLRSLPERFPLEPETWDVATAATAEARSGAPQRLDDGSLLFAAPTADAETYTISFDTTRTGLTALRLEALPDDRLPQHGPGHAPNGNFVLSGIEVEAGAAGSAAQPVALVCARADAEQQGFAVEQCLEPHSRRGWAVDVGAARNAAHTAVFEFAAPVGAAGGTRFVVRLQQRYGGRHTIGRLRLAVGAAATGGLPTAAARRAACERTFAAFCERAAADAVAWTQLRPRSAKSNLPLLTVQDDDSVFASGDITKADTYELEFAAPPRGLTALRLEALPDERLPGRGPGMTYYEGPPGDFFLGEFELYADGRRVPLARASESYAGNSMGGAASAQLAIDGDPQTGWSTAGRAGERHTAVFLLQAPLEAAQTLAVRMQFGRYFASSLGRFRIAATTHAGGAIASALPDDVEAALAAGAVGAPGTRDRVFAEFLRTTPELASARLRLRELEAPPGRTTTLALRERGPDNPRTTFVHRRGEYLQPTERVGPGAIEAVAPFATDLPRNRLGLARWIASTDNPLTARVAVNRAWQALFGQGIVRTLGDFGYQGEPPTHPELLDWLAVEFVRRGWSQKQLHRLIVTSATYRQSSRVDAERLRADPDDRLLSRGPRLRLEAEVLRDAVLRGCGLLSLRAGGPGTYPPQPAGVTEVAYGSPAWPTSRGEDRYRRSLYTFQKRTAPFALYATFDAPSGETCLARRDRSNTPLQALAMLNDELVLDAARALARSLAAMPDDRGARIDSACLRLLSRHATDLDVRMLGSFYGIQRSRLETHTADAAAIAGPGDGDPVEVAVWTLVVRVLCNLDELLTRS
jgi:hypothetical protein